MGDVAIVIQGVSTQTVVFILIMVITPFVMNGCKINFVIQK